jgi:hypothetical protein
VSAGVAMYFHVTLEDTKVDIIRIHIRQDSPIVENLWDKVYIL